MPLPPEKERGQDNRAGWEAGSKLTYDSAGTQHHTLRRPTNRTNNTTPPVLAAWGRDGLSQRNGIFLYLISSSRLWFWTLKPLLLPTKRKKKKKKAFGSAWLTFSIYKELSAGGAEKEGFAQYIPTLRNKQTALLSETERFLKQLVCLGELVKYSNSLEKHTCHF